MSTVTAMAARYTTISLEDMEKFLKRAFRVLEPKKGVERREVVYDLFLSPKVGIRVWTSIGPHSGTGAGVGADAIRVTFFNFQKNRPLLRGKSPIVKRTQNWRDSLRNRIEDIMEMYDEKEDYWESR